MQRIRRLHIVWRDIWIIFPRRTQHNLIYILGFIKDIENSSLTDLELVRLYKQNADLAILGELYQRYMDLLYAVCLKYLKEAESSKDAVMGIFEELIGKLQKHEITNFKSWLYMLTKNYCLMQLRSKNRMRLSDEHDLMELSETVHLEPGTCGEENLNQLSKCIEQLGEDQKQLVQLFYLQEKSYKEISAITNREWNSVRSLIQNGRRNLKNCMGKNPAQEL